MSRKACSMAKLHGGGRSEDRARRRAGGQGLNEETELCTALAWRA